MAKLTKTFIDKVASPSKGYQIHWDDTVKGYGLRVTAAGKKVFVAQGRVSGKAVIVTIGPYGLYAEDKARRMAQKILQDMREGIDPRAARNQDEAAKVTLRQVADAYFARPGKLKKTTVDEMERHVAVVLAAWEHRPIASITETEVRLRHLELAEGGLRGKRPAPATANATMVTLRSLINFAGRQYRIAGDKPLIQRNPVGIMVDHWAKQGDRTERTVPANKSGAVWNKLLSMRGEAQGYEALASVDLTIFALLTGARRNEIANLTWDRVNIDDSDPSDCWWHLHNRKRGKPIWLPLSPQAVTLLKSRPRPKVADGTESPFVFPSWGKSGHIQDARTPMQAVSGIAGQHLSLHDLRRTFTNIAICECRIEKFRVDMLTGHKPSPADVTAYNYLNLTRLNWLQPEAQMVGDWIEQQARVAAAKASGANVTVLRA